MNRPIIICLIVFVLLTLVQLGLAIHARYKAIRLAKKVRVLENENRKLKGIVEVYQRMFRAEYGTPEPVKIDPDIGKMLADVENGGGK